MTVRPAPNRSSSSRSGAIPPRLRTQTARSRHPRLLLLAEAPPKSRQGSAPRAPRALQLVPVRPPRDPIAGIPAPSGPAAAAISRVRREPWPAATRSPSRFFKRRFQKGNGFLKTFFSSSGEPKFSPMEGEAVGRKRLRISESQLDDAFGHDDDDDDGQGKSRDFFLLI